MPVLVLTGSEGDEKQVEVFHAGGTILSPSRSSKKS